MRLTSDQATVKYPEINLAHLEFLMAAKLNRLKLTLKGVA